MPIADVRAFAIGTQHTGPVMGNVRSFYKALEVPVLSLEKLIQHQVEFFALEKKIKNLH